MLSAASTSGFALDYAGDERELSSTELGESWLPEDAAALEADVEWVHAAPLLRSDFPAATLAAFASGRRSRSTARVSSACPPWAGSKRTRPSIRRCSSP